MLALVARARAEAAAARGSGRADAAADEAALSAALCAPLPVLRALPLPPSLRAGRLHLTLDAVTCAAEEALLRWLRSRPAALPAPAVDAPSPAAHGAWTSLRSRRVLLFGGEAGAGAPRPAPLPPPLAAISAALVACGAFPADRAPNHALVNEYARGQGILAHTDGPAYWPRTATLSLASPAIMQLLAAPRRDAARTAAEALCEVVLPARSLVVFDGSAYEALHAIPPRDYDAVGETAPCLNPGDAPAGASRWLREPRVSITLRHVPEAPLEVPKDAAAEGAAP